MAAMKVARDSKNQAIAPTHPASARLTCCRRSTSSPSGSFGQPADLVQIDWISACIATSSWEAGGAVRGASGIGVRNAIELQAVVRGTN